MSTNIYQSITDGILKALETGVMPWHRPWVVCGDGGMPLRHNKVPYQGINTLILWCAQERNNFARNIWLTFNQVKKLGGSVAKGSKAEYVVFADKFSKEETNTQTGEKTLKPIYYLKSYCVFNLCQTTGLEEEYPLPKLEEMTPKERNATCDAFIDNTGIPYRHHGDSAYYKVTEDQVTMPELVKFETTEHYYATFLHELTHATGHGSRLDRKYGHDKGGADYAYEELIAELGASFACARLGLDNSQTMKNHESYLASWIKALHNDTRMIVKAASQAQKACEYLYSKQPGSVQDNIAEQIAA